MSGIVYESCRKLPSAPEGEFEARSPGQGVHPVEIRALFSPSGLTLLFSMFRLKLLPTNPNPQWLRGTPIAASTRPYQTVADPILAQLNHESTKTFYYAGHALRTGPWFGLASQ